MTPDALFDVARAARIGIPEAIMCQGKSPSQIAAILDDVRESLTCVLLTRLTPEAFQSLPETLRESLDYDPISRTALSGTPPTISTPPRVAIVTAGTSDIPIAREAARTLAASGHGACEIPDVGVAGLWRILDRVEELRTYPIIIVIAGMDGALFSVLGGLVASALIAVPVSTGYGASRAGETALAAALASCAPGVTVVNIDNGYGAACAALRILGIPKADPK
jgi:pyridinium-3,5-biscarboxylic acid mononucleotide synthase